MNKKKSNVSFGPGAASLILIFVVLSMSVLGMLTLMNSLNDARLSDQSAKVIEAVYTLNEAAESHYAELEETIIGSEAARAAYEQGDMDAYAEAIESLLPEDMKMDDGVVSWVESDGYRTIDCAVQILPAGSEKRMEWFRHDLMVETEDTFW